jgi:TPR repeat protein
LYHLGLGVEANAERAIELYLKVAEQQIYDEHLSAIAYHNLAQIYSCCHGGIEPDPQKAREYRVRSKELGFEM